MIREISCILWNCIPGRERGDGKNECQVGTVATPNNENNGVNLHTNAPVLYNICLSRAMYSCASKYI